MTPTRRRIRIVLVAVMSVLVAAAAAVHALWPRAPRTEVEKVMRAHVEFMDAYLAGDFGDLWELIAEGERADLASRFEVGREEAAARLERGLTGYVERHPDARRNEVEVLKSLRISRVDMGEHVASVVFEEADWSAVMGVHRTDASSRLEVKFHYVRENGRWKFRGGTHYTMGFKTLDWKLDVFLPKVSRRAGGRRPDAVVTIGPEGLSPEGEFLLMSRLRECLAEYDDAWVVLDVAPTASWQSAIRAREAIRELGIYEVAFAAATMAGPGPGVRVNGIPVSVPYDPDESTIDPGTVNRVISLAGYELRPSEFRLECPNPETVEGLPWVLEVSFTNRGAVPVEAFPMRDGDPTFRLVLESADPDLVRAHLKAWREARRAELEPGDDVVFASPDLEAYRIVVAVIGPADDAVPGSGRVTLRPGERTTRIDTLPWRAGEWFVRAEFLDPHGRWRSSDSFRLSTVEPGGDRPSPEELRARVEDPFSSRRTEPVFSPVLVSRGEGILRRAALAGDGSDPKEHLAALGRIARSVAEPSLRLLAALAARRVREKDGLDLLRALASRVDDDPALVEAARRLGAE